MSKRILPQIETVEQVAATFKGNYPQLAAKCNGRIEKAIDLASSGYVILLRHNLARVHSQSRDTAYDVSLGAFGSWAFCECSDNRKSGNTCKHILAAEFATRAQELERNRAIREYYFEREEMAEVAT